MRLGSFGEDNPAPVEPDTIEYFGAELRISPDLTDADLLDFMDSAGDVDEDDPRAATAVKDFMRRVFADDFVQFWALAQKHRQSTEQRMVVAMEVVGLLAARPTQRSTGSAGGPAQTGTTSPADFASAAARRLEADALAAQRELEGRGRADLAVAPLNFREHLERTASG